MVELSKLVTLELIRRRTKGMPSSLIDQGLHSDSERRIARALAGEISAAKLSRVEASYLKQVRALASAFTV